MNRLLNTYINEKKYDVIVNVKKVKNIIFRFDGEKFVVSAPKNVKDEVIFKHLNSIGTKLIKKSVTHNSPFTESTVYVLGKKQQYIIADVNEIDENYLRLKSKDDFYRLIKPYALELFKKRIEQYENLMKIKNRYNVKIRNMKSRYGSNSRKTRSICLDVKLIHYNLDIIDSVIVHELCHDNCFNHQNQFYEKVYRFYPNYDNCHKKLRTKQYE